MVDSGMNLMPDREVNWRKSMAIAWAVLAFGQPSEDKEVYWDGGSRM